MEDIADECELTIGNVLLTWHLSQCLLHKEILPKK